MKKLMLFVGLILPFLSYSQEVVKAKYGKGIVFAAPDTSFQLKLGVRIQTLFEASKVLEKGSPISKSMQIRRARLKFDGFIFNPKLEYKIELAVSNRDNASVHARGGNGANIVLDGVVKYNATNNLQIWFGQTKLPGNRERVISSGALQFVDRSLVNSEFNLDRDCGVQVHHQFKIGKVVLRDKWAVSLGEGRNITEPDSAGGLNYTGRFEILPFGEFTRKGDYFDVDLEREAKPKLAFGAGYNFNDGALRSQGQLGSEMDKPRDINTFFADAMFKYRGLSVTTEFMNKTVNNAAGSDSTNTYYSGSGWNLQSGYLFKNNIEIAGRITMIRPSDALNKRLSEPEPALNEYTLGISKYIKGHLLKIQTDISYLEIQNEKPELGFRFQVEAGF